MRLKGGMGNQMFQYALGLQLAKVLDTELQIDLSSLLDRSKGEFVYRDYDLPIFNVQNQFVINPTLLRTIYRPKISRITKSVRQYLNRGKIFIKEQHFHFQPSLLSNPTDNAIYEGWFQSYRYFENIESNIRKTFTFKQPILEKSTVLHQRIKASNAVCLNVRRTDFLKVATLNTTNKAYFLKAVDYIATKIERPVFFIFSDDVEWCRENLRLNYPVEVVGHEHKGERFGNYMQLMMACKHFIIPNSSFAWWAVWLNENPTKKVVAPKNWFADPSINTADLIPSDWVRL